MSDARPTVPPPASGRLPQPTVRCPKCGASFVLPLPLPDAFQCVGCGQVAFPNMEAPAREYLRAATAAVGRPSPLQFEEDPVQRQVILVRGEKEAPLFRLSPATAAELGAPRAPVGIDPGAIQRLLNALPQAAFTGALLSHRGTYVLQVAPELCRQLAAGTARHMTTPGGSLYSGIVSLSGNVIIGQASFAPVSAATLGIAAAWQMLSLLVAQKHLYDIHTRLDQLTRAVDELKHQMEQDLLSDLESDLEHLRTRTLARKKTEVRTSSEPDREVLPGLDEVIRQARARHKKLSDRLTAVEGKFQPDRRARFGTTLGGVEREMNEEIDQALRRMAAMRLNAFVFASASALAQEHGATPQYITELRADLDRLLAADDQRFEATLGRVEHSVMNLRSVFQRWNDGAARLRLAGQVWRGAQQAGQMRVALHRALEQPPSLWITVDDPRRVTAVEAVQEVLLTG